MMFNHVMAKGGRLNEWIVGRLDDCSRNPKSLAEAMGVPQPRISELIAGKWQLPLDKAPAFARHLQISLEDAAHGFAFHELPNGDRPAPIDHTKPEIVQAAGEEYAAITRWDIRASAGQGLAIPETPDAKHRILFRLNWLQRMTRAPLERVFAVEVEGDSMEPTLRQGDLILVDTTRVDPGADSIFLLDDGELKVKRVQRDPRNGMLVIKSDNPHYEDFSDVPPENVRIVGRVFWVGRHF